MADGLPVLSEMEEGYLNHCIEHLIMKIRLKLKQNESPSVMDIDTQSTKWGNRLSDNGYDANKKVKGIKRNIAVDRNGFILGRVVSSAAIHDFLLAEPVFTQVADVWSPVKKGLVDRGYRGQLVEDIKRNLDINIEICSTPNGVIGFTPKPLRWVVERTFAWLDGFSKLTRNYEISNESAEGMIDFATVKLLLKHI